MPDRLSDLRRQRALLQEHLAWLDREIAQAAQPSATPATDATVPSAGARPLAQPTVPPHSAGAASQPPNAPATSTVRSNTAPAEAEIDAILAQYRQSGGALRNDVRKGCFLYFAIAFVLLGLGIVALYYLVGSH